MDHKVIIKNMFGFKKKKKKNPDQGFGQFSHLLHIKSESSTCMGCSDFNDKTGHLRKIIIIKKKKKSM